MIGWQGIGAVRLARIAFVGALCVGLAPAAEAERVLGGEHPVGRISAESWARADVFPAGTPASELPEGSSIAAGGLIVFDVGVSGTPVRRFCTTNFVFSETGRLAGRLYLGTAGYCIDDPGLRYFVCILDCQVASASPDPEITGSFVEIGPLVHHVAPQGGGVSLTDFALIEVPCEYRRLVDPAVQVWGGPLSLAASAEPAPGELGVFHGYGLGPGQASPDRIGIFDEPGFPGSFSLLAPASNGDSGSPVLVGVPGEPGMLSGGAAVGIFTGPSANVSGDHAFGNHIQNALAVARADIGALEVVLAEAESELLDTDDDGLLDCEDNCPFVSNPDQADSGGLATTDPDGIGDVCQCGDVNDDGIVNGNDATLISFACIDVGGRFPGRCARSQESPRFAWEKCSVGADPEDLPWLCNGNDATLILLAALGRGPGIQDACPAYHPIFP